jgi:hypothetical protein
MRNKEKIKEIIKNRVRNLVSEAKVSKNKIVDGYVSAVLFSESDDEGNSLNRNYTSRDVSPSALKIVRSRVSKFIQSVNNYNPNMLEFILSLPGYSNLKFGMDIYFTTHGHGVGFWDRKELGVEFDGKDVGDLLTDLAEDPRHDQVGGGFYISDDGEIETM